MLGVLAREIERHDMSYRDKVVRLITARTGEALMNGSIDDATIITQEAFNYAGSTVRILSNRLSPDCYARESVRNAAKFFLADPDHKLRILIESPLWDVNNNFEWHNHPLLQDIKEFAKGDDEARRLAVRLVPKAQAQRYKCNFLLLDDYGFRYEADRNSTAAVAAFFSEKEKEQKMVSLDSMFRELWSKSSDLNLN
jgi:hypothetical protein